MRLMRFASPLTFCVVSTLHAQTGTALVRHAPTLNGTIQGSVQVMTAENVVLNGGASVSGDLLMPGTPTVLLNGNPLYGGTRDGTGVATPTSHRVTLNGSASLRSVIRRKDAVTLPAVAAPPLPTGTRSVSLNQAGQAPGDFASIKDLSLAGNVGPVAIPPGAYGDFSARAGNSFVIGVVGGKTPATYSFLSLDLGGGASLEAVGPVVVTLGGDLTVEGQVGNPNNPDWVTLRLAQGGVSIGGNRTMHAVIEAPHGIVDIEGGARLTGRLAAAGLVIAGNARLVLIEPASKDSDNDGMDDEWETAHGLNILLDDSAWDNDQDGFSNSTEYQLGLNPANPDTDGDGLYDGDEIALGLDPKVPSPDTEPPSIPTGLAAGAVSPDGVTLSWEAATDNLKVAGYIVYRDGQPVETAAPIRETTFADTNLPEDEEFSYQIRAFDFAGNLSPPGPELLIQTAAEDDDGDGLPDAWERKYFDEEDAAAGADPDGDGRTNLEEFQAGTNPVDFYNGIKPTMEASDDGEDGREGELTMTVRKPDGAPWPNAPVNFDSSSSRRKIALSPSGPFASYQLKVRTGSDGVARCYLEPWQP